MSRGQNQKFKFSYLMKIMLEKTDDEHSLTMPQIMSELEKYDVTAERKSIYKDFEDMTDHFNIEIVKEQKGRETYYHVGKREFDLAEVKLLVDAIQASKFITTNKSVELLKKIKHLVSINQWNELQRQVFISDRVKARNDNVFNNVNIIHEALTKNMKICFQYYKWDINKNLVPRHDGAMFVVSPWALTWAEENYYLIAFDEWEQIIKHYRVDKMLKVSILKQKREARELFEQFDMAQYSKSTFGMFNGKKTQVKIRFKKEKCGIFLDQFGKDISFKPVDDEHYEFHVEVYVSQHFYGWIFGLGEGVQVVGPEEVVKEMRDAAKAFLEGLQ